MLVARSHRDRSAPRTRARTRVTQCVTHKRIRYEIEARARDRLGAAYTDARGRTETSYSSHAKFLRRTRQVRSSRHATMVDTSLCAIRDQCRFCALSERNSVWCIAAVIGISATSKTPLILRTRRGQVRALFFFLPFSCHEKRSQ